MSAEYAAGRRAGHAEARRAIEAAYAPVEPPVEVRRALEEAEATDALCGRGIAIRGHGWVTCALPLGHEADGLLCSTLD